MKYLYNIIVYGQNNKVCQCLSGR